MCKYVFLCLPMQHGEFTLNPLIPVHPRRVLSGLPAFLLGTLAPDIICDFTAPLRSLVHFRTAAAMSCREMRGGLWTAVCRSAWFSVHGSSLSQVCLRLKKERKNRNQLPVYLEILPVQGCESSPVPCGGPPSSLPCWDGVGADEPWGSGSWA